VLATTHKPVLVTESIETLAVQPGGRYVDCTLGGGGHAVAMLEHSSPGGQLLGIDADPDAIVKAQARMEAYRDSILIVNDNFVNLEKICRKHNFYPIHGILLDLGLSSFQLDADPRGFSFQHDADLDMRLSPEQNVKAADIVNTYSEKELAFLLHTYGEESYANRIARYIVQRRPVNTTVELAGIIESAVGGRRGKIHPATKSFQALRIAVNEELKNLTSVLEQAVKLLGYGGRLVVISYHSLEDRIVKQFMHRESTDCICPPRTPVCICKHKASLRLVNKKIIKPTDEEIRSNPRSRSAKLRAAERITDCDARKKNIKKTKLVITKSVNNFSEN